MKILFFIPSLCLCIYLFYCIHEKFKHNSTFKKFFYFFIFIGEVFTATTLLNIFLFSTSVQTTFDVIKNYLASYTIYQLIVLVTFRFWDASRIDAKTLIKNTSDELQIAAEFKQNISDEAIKFLNEETSLKNDVAWTKNDKSILEELLERAQNYNKDKEQVDINEFRHRMKQISRAMDFEMKIYSFSWMNSIILRKIK